MARAMAPAAYPRVALGDGLRRREGSAFHRNSPLFSSKLRER